MGAVGHAQLRQGTAGSGREGRPRDLTRPVPQRSGGGPLVPGLIGPDEVRTISEAALEQPGADGIEVLFMHEWGGLTRFANSSIHQSTWREDTGIRVRVVTGGRVGVAASNDFSKDGAAKAAVNALEMARVVGPDPNWPGLAPKANVPSRDGFDDATAGATPEGRAEAVATAIAQLGSGFHAARAF